LRDLEAISDFIAEESSAEAAQRMIQRLFEGADRLAMFPHAGRAGRISGTRELVVASTPFLIPYRVRDERVEILAVFHGARRWPDAFH
jgi:plasmid stabilization system protein ParE